jgi:hypothetical protein
MACLATCLAQRLSTGQRLWLFAWQSQKAVVPGSIDPAGLDTSLRTTTQAGLSVPRVPDTYENPGYRAIGLVISMTGSNG